MTKQVQLADDAYERLKRAKRPDESFSDLIRRRFPQGSLLDLRNMRPKQDIDDHARMLEETDALEKEKMERRMRDRGLA